MRHPLSAHAWVIAFALVQFAAGEPLDRNEWRYFSPILSSQTRPLGAAESILAGFCQTPIRAVEKIGRTCTTRQLGAGFSDITDRTFSPKGVIFGHFLGPENDDAAVSGWSAETHPYRGGGTLLLSRRRGVWIPIWYRSALIIDSCEKIAPPGQRETLLCEDEDGGMGHELHYLYTVDFAHPTDLKHSLLAKADSFKDFCVEQKQVLKGLQWRPDRQGFSVELVTSGWRHSSEPYCENYFQNKPPASLRLTFAVTSEGLRRVETESGPKQ